MSPRADRLLTRLWLALAASSVLAMGLHLGAAVGAGRWLDLAPGATAAPRRVIPSLDGTGGGLARKGLPTPFDRCEASSPPS